MEIPYIYAMALPPDEQRDAEAINHNLRSLSSATQHLSDAIELFDYCQSMLLRPGQGKLNVRARHNMKLSRWQIMAARVGAIAIYEFYQITQAINKSLQKCPTLRPYVDCVARKNAAHVFDANFPDFADIRNNAAHGLESTTRPGQIDRDALKGNPVVVDGITFTSEGSLQISGSIIGTKFTNTHNGRVINYSVTKETESHLLSALAHWFAAFRPLEEFTRELLRRRSPPTSEPPPQG